MTDEEENKGGAPTKYKDEYDEQVYKLCLLGAIDEELADFFNVCVATINNWKKTEPQFLASIKRGKKQADSEVAQKLFKRATGYTHPEEKVFCNDGQIITHDTTKRYPPDTTACIFWLKNRQPDDWRDKQDIDHNHELTVFEPDMGEKKLKGEDGADNETP